MARCVFEIFKSLVGHIKFLYDVATANPHFLYTEDPSEGGQARRKAGKTEKIATPRSAATILDGLAEVDTHYFDICGGLQGAADSGFHLAFKTDREAVFPEELCDRALEVAVESGNASVPSDRKHILRAIVGLSAPSHGASEPCNCEEPPVTHSKYNEVSRALQGRFAASVLRRGVEAGGEKLERYLTALEGARRVYVCAHAPAHTHRRTQTNTQPHRHTDTQTHRHTDRNTRHAHAHTGNAQRARWRTSRGAHGTRGTRTCACTLARARARAAHTHTHRFQQAFTRATMMSQHAMRKAS